MARIEPGIRRTGRIGQCSCGTWNDTGRPDCRLCGKEQDEPLPPSIQAYKDATEVTDGPTDEDWDKIKKEAQAVRAEENRITVKVLRREADRCLEREKEVDSTTAEAFRKRAKTLREVASDLEGGEAIVAHLLGL